MHGKYTTSRLVLDELHVNDAAFIKELVNTPGWLKFIGNRKVHTHEDALAYVQKIIDNPNIYYWVAKLQGMPVGIVTLIKREYLEHYDIGFAFLPEHSGKGYAYEAATAVLKDAADDPAHTHILATTLEENTGSIKLLQKLGLRFEKGIAHDGEALLLYGIPVAGWNAG